MKSVCTLQHNIYYVHCMFFIIKINNTTILILVKEALISKCAIVLLNNSSCQAHDTNSIIEV